MNDPYLLLTPLLMLGVMALARFVGCSYPDFQFRDDDDTDVPLPTAFVMSPPGYGLVRNDFTGWIGMAIEVGPNPIEVWELGRTMLTATTQSHVVKIVQPDDAGGVVLGFVTIPPKDEPSEFAYVPLPTPVTLTPSQVFFVVSHEQAEGDSWHHVDTLVATTEVAQVTSGVFNDDATPGYVLEGSAGHTFGPVDFKYVQPE